MADTQKAISYSVEELDAAIPKAQNALQRTGGAMTGALTLAADPTEPMHAATRQFVLNNTPTGVVKSVNGETPDANGNVQIEFTGGSEYELPTASATVKGGVKVGEGLQMDGDVLSVRPGFKLRLVKEIVASEEVSELAATADTNGNAISIKNAFIRATIPPTENVGASVFFIDGMNGFYFPSSVRKEYEVIVYAFIDTLSGFLRVTDSKFIINHKDWGQQAHTQYTRMHMCVAKETMSMFSVNASGGSIFPSGTKFEVYEVIGYA